MLSVDNVSLIKGRSYYQKENYYSNETAKEFSQWHGKLAEELKLNGQVNFKTFDKLLFGFDQDGNSIATNSVNEKAYREPEITKKEFGKLKFTVEKICENYPFKQEEFLKIEDIIKYHTRHNNKITPANKKMCLAQINRVIKDSDLKPIEREESYRSFDNIITTVSRPKERRAGYDLTFSAPKSVSIMALVHKDKDVLNAHRQAVKETLNYIESKYALTRTGNNDDRTLENTEKIAIAQFEHNTSRENDPQLHTHNVVLNLIKRSDGKWRSLHADDFRNYSKLFGVIYQNQLAKKLYEAGYEIAPDKDGTIKILNVSQELCDTFSKRRKQLLELGVTDQKSARDLVYVDRAKKAKEIDANKQHQIWLDETKHAGVDLSKVKGIKKQNVEFDIEKVRALIHEAFSEASKMKMGFKLEEAFENFAKFNLGKFDLLKVVNLFEEEVEKKLIQVDTNLYVTKEALKLEKNTIKNLENTKEVQSIYKDSTQIEQLIQKKLIYSLEKKNELLNEIIEKINQNVTPEKKDDIINAMRNLIHDNKRLTLEENENLKSYLSEIVKEIKLTKIEKKELKADLYNTVDKASELTKGQKEAIKQTLLNNEEHIVWLGVAGAGKTFSLATVVEEAKQAGIQVEGFTQNKKAAEILANETKINVNTIASLLLREEKNSRDNNKKLWIVDEAGMIGAKLGHDFVERAKKENARLIIVGDNRQLSSPTAGHFLKLVTQFTKIKTVELNKSVRQKDENLAKGVEVLNSLLFEDLYKKNYRLNANKKIDQALNYFKNSIQEYKTPEARVDNLTKTYLSLTQQERDKTLIIAKTHATISEITKKIRSELTTQGYLKNEIKTKTYSLVDLSENKGKYAQNYSTEQCIIFDSDNIITYKDKALTVIKDQEFRIVKTDLIQNLITIENDQGNKFTFDPGKFRYEKKTKNNELSILPVYKQIEINISENDRLSWSKNIAKSGRVNKKEFKVLNIDQKTNQMKIVYNNGIIENIDLNAKNFYQHSWAVTYNAGQGETKKNVLGIIDGLNSVEDIYTLFTRATHNLKVFVESEDKLKSYMSKSGSKKTAMEIVNQTLEKQPLTKSNKMDFYDRHQRVVYIDKNKIILSFSAPSDVSSLLLSHPKNKESITNAHQNAIKRTLQKFNELIEKDYKYINTTKETIFNGINLSKILFLHSNIEVSFGENSNGHNNHYKFMEYQNILKHMYQHFLSENLQSAGIDCYNEDGILRVSERNDHVHATFSEEFEKNMKFLLTKYKDQGFDKFASIHQIEKFANEYKSNEKILDWNKIDVLSINETEKNYKKLNKIQIIQNTVYNLCQDLQVFNETNIYEKLLLESKGHINFNEVNELHKEVLIHDHIKFIEYDRFGKMVFAHKELNDDEARILIHSAKKESDKNFILSFERLARRIEKNNSYSEEQIAVLSHILLDSGKIKFLSGLHDKDVQSVLNEATELYKHSGYKVLNVYAGRQFHTKTILNREKDMHLGYLLNKIYEKRISIDSKTVIILKDIGNNLTKNASTLFDLAKENGAKVIFHANENDFDTTEKKRYLKSLKNVAGINLKQRYRGFIKQNEFYQANEKNEKANNTINYKKFKSFYHEQKEVLSEEDTIRLNHIMSETQKFYANQLFSEQGKEALAYLQQRGFTIEQIKEHGIGLSFTKGLDEFSKKVNFTDTELNKLSLITIKEDNTKYDFYRNRIMIPIKDSNGNTVSFGARIYRKYEVQKKVSKYINSRNTPIFSKREILFGLDNAKQSIKNEGKVYVVEGYMDAIAMQNAGIKNVVAVMGTALSQENLNQLSQYTKEIVLLFDNDRAGINASKLSYLQSINSNLSLYHTSITKEKDPDEYLKKYGAEDFKNEILNNQVPLNYYVNRQYQDENNNILITEWRKEILPSILNINDPIMRSYEFKASSIALNTEITQLIEKKHYKFIPEAFLSEKEKQQRQDYFKKYNINKNVTTDKFDNTIKSKEMIAQIFREHELIKAVEFEIKKLHLDASDIDVKAEFIKNNDKMIQNLKDQILYNETVIHETLKNEIKNVTHLDIYKHLNQTYQEKYPQEINDILFQKQNEQEKALLQQAEVFKPYIHIERIKNEVLNGKIQGEIENIKDYYQNKNILDHFYYKYTVNMIEKISTLECTQDEKEKLITNQINVDSFKEFIQDERLKSVVEHQNDLKKYLKVDIEKYCSENKEFSQTYNKMNSKEKITFVDSLVDSKIEKNLNNNDNMKNIDKYYNQIFQNKDILYNIISNKINQIKAVAENIQKENQLNSLQESLKNLNEKERLKNFESKILNEVSNKLKNKQIAEDVFIETRKILIKESKFIDKDENNSLKAYFNLANDENMHKFKDIIADINFNKLERKIEIKNNIITNETLPNDTNTNKNAAISQIIKKEECNNKEIDEFEILAKKAGLSLDKEIDNDDDKKEINKNHTNDIFKDNNLFENPNHIARDNLLNIHKNKSLQKTFTN